MTENKIKTLTGLKKITRIFKHQGKRIVFTNGCFDILHYGHLKYLKSARSLGQVLIVAVNSDSSVRKLKGRNRPINKENQRLALISGLECVDYCLLFKEATPWRLIKELRPDILVKGGDWDKKDIVGSSLVESYGGKVKTIKFVRGFSTTGLINKILKIDKK